MPDPIKPNDGGGTGAIPEGEYHHKRGELKMLQMAIKKRWIIPKDAPEVLPNEMYQIATTREVAVIMGEGESAKTVMMPNSRSQIAATKVLLEMEGQNQADEHVAEEAQSGTGTVRVIVERRALIVANEGRAGDSPALPSGPAAADRQRATIQRGDVGKAGGQDDHG